MPIFRHRVSGPGSAGDTWTCTMHSFAAIAPVDAHAAWVVFVTDFVNDTLGPMWKTTTSVSAVTTDSLDSDGLHNVQQLSTSLSLPGTGTGAAVSPRNTVVIGLRTLQATRSGRGRMSWPSPDASHYETTGLFKATDIAAIAAGFRAALVIFQETTAPVILHRGHEGSPTNTPSTYDDIWTINVGTIPGSQRRRTNKVTNARTSVAL